MRILFIGQAAFGSDALAALVEQGEEVVGVITSKGRGEVPDPVAVKAEELGLPVFTTSSLRISGGCRLGCPAQTRFNVPGLCHLDRSPVSH